MKLTLLVVLFSLVLCNASLSISNTLGSNMVLQRAPLVSKIWGWVDVGATVTVNFNNNNIQASVDSTGAWAASLPATPAGGPYVISISASTGDKLALDNVLFGDVYVCSGQSNMQFTVDSAFNASYEVGLADKFPNIRVFSVGVNNANLLPKPVNNLVHFDLGWSVASSKTIGGGNWTYMSAVCWFFGRDLFNQYQIPVGLISTNWGGTYIQTWSSPEVLAKCDVPAPPFNVSNGPNQPSVLYNSMIVPFLPQSIRGALWYQGESNVGNAPLYACLFPAMIADWRTKFGSGYAFDFFFVQLAPWISTAPSSIPVAQLRDSQLAALKLPGVGYASAIDLGDPTSPFDPIHPRNKQTDGSRLVLAARNIAYGETSVVWQGPTFSSATQSVSNGVAAISVTFTTYGKPGLTYVTATCPTQVPSNTCAGWEVGLSDGNWYPGVYATHTGTSNVVVVTLTLPSASLTVKGVRYAYAIWPLTSLFSAEGLPAIPFTYSF